MVNGISARMTPSSSKKGDREVNLLLFDIATPFRRAATSEGNDFT